MEQGNPIRRILSDEEEDVDIIESDEETLEVDEEIISNKDIDEALEVDEENMNEYIESILGSNEDSNFEKNAKEIAQQLDASRFSDIYIKNIEKPVRKKKAQREESNKKKLTKRKEKITKGIISVPKEKFTLWRNLNEYLDKQGLAEEGKNIKDVFDTWNTDLISSVETNCMLKQTTQCTDTKRLSVLMDAIKNNEDPETIQLHEVLELIHDKTENYHSAIGMRFGFMAHADSNTKKRKLAQIKQLSVEYANDIFLITKWILNDDYLDILFPESDIPEKFLQSMRNKVEETKFDVFSKLVRKVAIKNRIFQLIDLDVDEVEKGAENLYGSVKVSYLQKQGLRSKKSWGQHRYEVEAHELYKLMFRMVVIRDDIDYLQKLYELYPPTNPSSIQELRTAINQMQIAEEKKELSNILSRLSKEEDNTCIDLNVYAKKIYVNKIKTIAKLFEDYYGIFRNIFEVLISSKMIPSPFAQSTYRIVTKKIIQDDVFTVDVDACNMLMWPDRFANTLNPSTRRMINRSEGDFKIRSQIIDDYLDPWYWQFYRLNNFKTKVENQDITISKIAQYFLKAQNGKTDDFEPILDEEYEDIELFNGSTRILNKDHPEEEKRTSIDPQAIYFVQYMNRLQRGVNEFFENNEPFVKGDYVYNGIIAKDIIDILHTKKIDIFAPSSIIRDNASIRELKASPSEFTVYMEALETTLDTTLGSYITYRYDIHPKIIQSLERDIAGHAYFLNLVSVKEKPHIWFKTTLTLYKPEKSTKPETVLKEFSSWIIKTIQIDAICDNSNSYPWKSFPEWMILMFKILANLVYSRMDYEDYLIMIPLDKLKRIGNVPENVMVYMLRKYLNFGLCINEKIKRDSSTEETKRGLYIGRDNYEYDYDYVIQDNDKVKMHKIYGIVDENGDVFDSIEKIDISEPILLRPIPTIEELWKMWQFYTQISYQMLRGSRSKEDTEEAKKQKKEDIEWERIPDLTNFLIYDKKLKSSRMREITLRGSNFGKIYTNSYIKEMEKNGDIFDPLTFDLVPLNWIKK